MLLIRYLNVISYRHLVVFGGLDDKLQVDEPSLLFDQCLNTALTKGCSMLLIHALHQ